MQGCVPAGAATVPRRGTWTSSGAACRAGIPVIPATGGSAMPGTQQAGHVEAHHVGKLAHPGKPGKPRPPRAELMARKRRKTLVVCAACHDTIHNRQPTATPTE